MGVALVTGTSSGIGLATAVSLARRGHTVIATMRNVQAATDRTQSLTSTGVQAGLTKRSWLSEGRAGRDRGPAVLTLYPVTEWFK